jgi:insertion element IS1 protein InsB
MTKFNSEDIEHVYADHWEAYRQFFPHNKLTQSKKNTHQIERNNGRQRHWLARFKRRSLVVTRSLEMLEISLWLFARFRVNGDICELTSLLR